MNLLLNDEIKLFLQNSKNWKYAGKKITKLFLFKSYMDSIGFVVSLAEKAELNNHHPDMIIGWRKINVSFTSHDEGDVTMLCIKMAEEADLIHEKFKTSAD